jgi:AcrR family transcriptional regulator
MIEPKHDKNSESSREALLEAAGRLFSEKGFAGTTVKELAEAAGVNVSLVSYHFDGKEGLLEACLERFGRARLESAQRVLTCPESLEDFRVRLKLFVEEWVTRASEDPQLCRLIHIEMSSGQVQCRRVFQDVFMKTFETFKNFVRMAQEQGFVRTDFDVHIAAGMFMGALAHAVNLDPMVRKMFGPDKSLTHPPYRDLVIREVVHNWIHGIKRGPE